MTGARDKAAAAAAIAIIVQRKDTVARVAATTREALLYLGLNPGQNGLVNAAMVAASTSSYAFAQMALPKSPRALMTHPIRDFHVYPQASSLSGECSPEVSVMAPSIPAPAPAHIDLNATPVAGGSSFGGTRKRVREMPANMLSGACNLFDRMPADIDDERANHFI
ncbi:putative serine/threonine-protein kinase [Hordeum vulgare]|nr:putative serine/threonine-protein kinase [Hordeum vulgare]